MPDVTLIREFNAEQSTPSLLDRARLAAGLASSVSCRTHMSVWLAFPPYEYDRDDHDYASMGTRIVGPVPEALAESVAQQLRTAFESAGFRVTLGAAADD